MRFNRTACARATAAVFLCVLLLCTGGTRAAEVDVEVVFPQDPLEAAVDVEEYSSEELPCVEQTIDPSRPVVALTFDDGPRANITSAILDTLERYQAAATFFVLGSKLDEESGALLSRMLSLGCEIGNHSWNHPQLKRLSDASVRWQLSATDEAVEKYTGNKPTVVRPPYGEITETICLAAERPLILWSLDTLDWKYRDVDRIVRSVLSGIQDGDIILMHDTYSTTAKAAERIIRELSERQWQMVTVSTLLSAREGGVEAGAVYRDLSR